MSLPSAPRFTHWLLLVTGLVCVSEEARAQSPSEAAPSNRDSAAEPAPGTAPPVTEPSGPADFAMPPPDARPVPPPPPRPRRYGDRGTPELAIALGYSSLAGFVGAAGFRYFVVDGVAPGIEGTYFSGGSEGQATGFVLATLRLVPIRTTTFAVALTGRAGRVILSDHADGWGAGGAASALYMVSPGIGLELGYEFLKLYPASFCQDLYSCVIHGPVLGLRVVL